MGAKGDLKHKFPPVEEWDLHIESLQQLFATEQWKLNKTDKRQTKCVSSLRLAVPQENLYLSCVRLDSLMEWLSAPEGPELIDSHSDPPTNTDMALAVGVDPEHLYQNPEGAIAGLGLIYKPSYISTMNFSSCRDLLASFLGEAGDNLSRACLLFLSISEESKIYPYVGDNPSYLDVVSKERAEARPTGGKLIDFRSFSLPRVLAKPTKNSTEYSHCTGYPRHLGGRPMLINPLAPKRKNEAFKKEMLRYPMSPAPLDHWAFLEDSEFQTWASSLKESREKAKVVVPDKPEDVSKTSPGDTTTGDGGESKEGEEEITEILLDDTETSKTPRERVKPLRTLMANAGLSTATPQVGGVSRTEEIVLNGDEARKRASLSPSEIKAIDSLMSRIHALHLQALFEMGSVRVVDRVSAERLMANFAHVNLIMGEDLNKSLRSLVDITKEAGDNLHSDIRAALGPTMFGMAKSNIDQVIEKYHQRLDSAVTQVLLYLDCARRDARAFLKERVSSLKSDKEFEEMISALSERLSNHASRVRGVILSPEMNDPKVGLRVNAALSATQPMVTNYFGGVLEGLMGSLSLAPSGKEESARSAQEGVERRMAMTLQRQSEEDVTKLQGLHIDYSHDFPARSSGISIPALSSTAVPNLLETMDRLRCNLPPAPEKPRSLLTEEPLFKKLLEVQAAYEGDNAEVYQLSEVLSRLITEFEEKKEKAKKEDLKDEEKSKNEPPTPPGDKTPPTIPTPPLSDPTPPHSKPPPELDPYVKIQRTKLGNVSGVLEPSKLPDPSSKQKKPRLLDKESENSSTALSNSVDDSTDSGIGVDFPSLKEASNATTPVARKRRNSDGSPQGPTPKKANLQELIEGVTVRHGKRSSSVTFYCKTGLTKGGIRRTQSLSDEDDEKGSFTDGDLSEKITTSPLFSSDEENLGSPTAKRKSDVDLLEPPSKKPGSKPKEASRKSKKKEEVKEPDSPSDSDSNPETSKEQEVKVSPSDCAALVKARLKRRMEIYNDDRTVVHLVRGSMLGLKGNQEPTAEAIEKSKIFRLRGAKEGPKGIVNISKHWVSRLGELDALGEAPLDEFEPREDWPQVYTWSNFVKYVPTIASSAIWGRKVKPSFVVIVPADSLELSSDYFLSLLHKEECITRRSVYYFKEPTDVEKTRIQYCFCAYCGVLSMNRDSGYSHLRKHLGVEFLCGGCLSFKGTDPTNVSNHMETCAPCVTARDGAEFAPERKVRKEKAK